MLLYRLVPLPPRLDVSLAVTAVAGDVLGVKECRTNTLSPLMLHATQFTRQVMRIKPSRVSVGVRSRVALEGLAATKNVLRRPT